MKGMWRVAPARWVPLLVVPKLPGISVHAFCEQDRTVLAALAVVEVKGAHDRHTHSQTWAACQHPRSTRAVG
eukprot:6492584-Amphidinium_carterae.1